MKVLPDFKEQQIHCLDERFYQSLNNPEIYYPGATEILSAYPKDYGFYEFLKRAGYAANEIRDFAADEGSAVHALNDTFLCGNPTVWTEELSLDEWLGHYRFQQFYWRYKPKTLFTEKIMVDDDLQYGGQLDWGFELEGENWLIDHKFTNAVRKTHYLQIMAYKRLVDPFIEIQRVGILHLKSQHRKEADFQGIGWKLWEVDKKDWDHYLKLFDYTHKLWQEENPNFKPKNKIYPMGFKIDEEPDMELLYGHGQGNNSED